MKEIKPRLIEGIAIGVIGAVLGYSLNQETRSVKPVPNLETITHPQHQINPLTQAEYIKGVLDGRRMQYESKRTIGPLSMYNSKTGRIKYIREDLLFDGKSFEN